MVSPCAHRVHGTPHPVPAATRARNTGGSGTLSTLLLHATESRQLLKGQTRGVPDTTVDWPLAVGGRSQEGGYPVVRATIEGG